MLSTQQFVPIKEIRDGVIILKNGSLRMVLMASALNFALKSQTEQEAIIFQFQNFLNSLDFSCQFFIQSRKLNINPYLNTLKDLEKNQINELLKIQTAEYIEFIKNLVESVNIVSKGFFVAIPYSPPILEMKNAGALGKITGLLSGKPRTETKNTDDKFSEYREQLLQRADVVTQELSRSGVRVIPLGSEEVIELFYHLFNPGEEEKQKAPTMQ